jgi:hypothetical protein
MADADTPVSFLGFVNRCQAAIGQIEMSQASGLHDIWRVFSRPPRMVSEVQRLMTLALVTELLTRLRQQQRITRVPTWAELSALFDGRSAEGATRRLGAFRSLEVQRSRRGRPRCPDPVGPALQILSESFWKADFSLAAVAGRLNVTAGHVGRLVRRRRATRFAGISTTSALAGLQSC